VGQKDEQTLVIVERDYSAFFDHQDPEPTCRGISELRSMSLDNDLAEPRQISLEAIEYLLRIRKDLNSEAQISNSVPEESWAGDCPGGPTRMLVLRRGMMSWKRTTREEDSEMESDADSDDEDERRSRGKKLRVLQTPHWRPEVASARLVPSAGSARRFTQTRERRPGGGWFR